MTPTLRPELKDIPIRMMDLPVDPERGYPVPWFVEWIDGKPEFRLMNGDKWIRAVKEHLCWCCGKRLGAFLTFVLGPMCGITRTTSEPPNHLSCARWAAKYCPFLSRPHMVRRNDEELKAQGATMSGIGLSRNPGVALLWTARDFQVWHPRQNETLIRVGDPDSWEWWCEGRAATQGEIVRSIETGVPLLEEVARQQAGGLEALHRQVKEFERFVPKA